MELTGEGLEKNEELGKRGCFFFWNTGRVFCFVSFCFFFPQKSWGWRLDRSVSSQEGGTEGPQSCLSPFPLLAALLLSSLYHFLTGRPAGRECRRGCDGSEM